MNRSTRGGHLKLKPVRIVVAGHGLIRRITLTLIVTTVILTILDGLVLKWDLAESLERYKRRGVVEIIHEDAKPFLIAPSDPLVSDGRRRVCCAVEGRS